MFCFVLIVINFMNNQILLKTSLYFDQEEREKSNSNFKFQSENSPGEQLPALLADAPHQCQFKLFLSILDRDWLASNAADCNLHQEEWQNVHLKTKLVLTPASALPTENPILNLNNLGTYYKMPGAHHRFFWRFLEILVQSCFTHFVFLTKRTLINIFHSLTSFEKTCLY